MRKGIIVFFLFLTGALLNAEVTEKFIGHYLRINDISTFNDKNKVVTVGQDEKIIVWNLEKSTILSELEIINGDPFTAVSVINNGKNIVAGTEYGMLWMFDDKLKKQKEFKLHDGKITGIYPLQNGERIVTSSEDGFVKFLNTRTEIIVKQHNFDEAITSLNVSEDKETVVAGSSNGMIYVIDGESELNVTSMINSGEKTQIKGIAFSGDSRYFVSIGFKNMINLYSTRFGEKINTITLPNVKNLYSVSWNIKDNIIVVGSDKYIHFLEPKIGFNSKVLEEIDSINRNSSNVSKILFNEEEKFMFSVSEDTNLRVWNLKDNTLVKAFSSY